MDILQNSLLSTI